MAFNAYDTDIYKGISSKTFVLKNLASAIGKTYLMEILDFHFGDDMVDNVVFYPNLSNRVLVTMKKNINLDDVAMKLGKDPVEGLTIEVEPVEISNRVIAREQDLLQKLTLLFLKLYFQSKFAGGDEVVCSINSIPDSISDIEKFVVSFTDPIITKKVLASDDHIVLPKVNYTIQVEPFYDNFHGLIRYKGKTLLEVLNEERRTFCTNVKDQEYPMSDKTNQQTSHKPKMEDIKDLTKSQSHYGSHAEGTRMSTLPVDDSIKTRKKCSYPFESSHFTLMAGYYREELNDALKNVNFRNIIQNRKVVLEIEGIEKDVNNAEESLENISSKIRTELIDVSKDFDAHRSQSLIETLSSKNKNKDIDDKQRNFEQLHKCCITNKLIVSREIMSSSFRPTGDNNKLVSGTADNQKQDNIFQVTPTIKLEIKGQGSIVNESSEVLVCILPYDKNVASTFIGQAFLKIMPGLQKKVEHCKFSSNGVGFELYPHLTMLPTCKCLALVVLPIVCDEFKFKRSVQEIFDIVRSYDYKSVSFPSMGHGKVIRYPIDVITKNFFLALISLRDQQFKASPKLQKITFLATDSELYATMVKFGPHYFPIASGNSAVDQRTLIEENQDDEREVVENIKIYILHKNDYDLAPLWKGMLPLYPSLDVLTTSV